MISACPHCGRKLQVEEAHVGHQVRCPGCQNTFTAAAEAAPGAAPAAGAPPLSGPVPLAAAPDHGRTKTAFRVTALAAIGKGGFLNFLQSIAGIIPLLILGGLFLVILARGCDTLGLRGVSQAVAKYSQVKEDFENKWAAKMAAYNKQLDEAEFEKNRIQREASKIGRSTDSTEEQKKEAWDRSEKAEQVFEDKKKDIDTKTEALRNDKEAERISLEYGSWLSLKKDADSAANVHASRSYWYGWMFLLGTMLLVFGLVGLAFTATGTVERVLSLGMIGVIVISLYIGGMAWSNSLASEEKGIDSFRLSGTARQR